VPIVPRRRRVANDICSDQEIFWLRLQQFRAMTGKLVNGNHPRRATLWRVTVESWLRCQGLIAVCQNQNVSPALPKIWSHN
jgi:hypothetical protein